MKEYIIDGYMLTSPDGGGMRDEDYGIVSTEEVAKEWCAQSKNWPRSYHKHHEVIRVFDTLAEMVDDEKRERRERALAKLSIEDRLLLGL